MPPSNLRVRQRFADLLQQSRSSSRYTTTAVVFLHRSAHGAWDDGRTNRAHKGHYCNEDFPRTQGDRPPQSQDILAASQQSECSPSPSPPAPPPRLPPFFCPCTLCRLLLLDGALSFRPTIPDSIPRTAVAPPFPSLSCGSTSWCCFAAWWCLPQLGPGLAGMSKVGEPTCN